MKSTNTFKDEFSILYNKVPEALYSGAASTDPIYVTSVLLEFLQEYQKNRDNYAIQSDLPTEAEYSSFIDPVGIDDFFQELNGSSDNEENFLNLFQQHFGISAIKVFEYLNQRGSRYDLANLIAEYGRDAFGCYLPMHAYYRSRLTPWGIYLFPIPIIARSIFLYREINMGLDWWQHFKFYLYAVYRHELFHFQVERFATKLEMLFYEPFYKPYNADVKSRVRGTEDWLEEALAEDSVLGSTLVRRRTKIKPSIFNEIYKFDLHFMPAGYRDYHCSKYHGPENAMRLFTSQIANCSVDPKKRTTDVITIKGEYNMKDIEVPGYIFINPKLKKRFQ